MTQNRAAVLSTGLGTRELRSEPRGMLRKQQYRSRTWTDRLSVDPTSFLFNRSGAFQKNPQRSVAAVWLPVLSLSKQLVLSSVISYQHG